MNENLKMKASPLLIVTRIIFLIITTSIVFCAFFGVVDIRSGEQKEADYRKEVLGKPSAYAVIKAIKISQKNYPYAEIEKVSVINGSGKVLVRVTALNSANQYVWTYYDAKNNTMVDESVYSNLYSSLLSYSFYTGRNGDGIETIFEGKDLMILCEEAKK